MCYLTKYNCKWELGTCITFDPVCLAIWASSFRVLDKSIFRHGLIRHYSGPAAMSIDAWINQFMTTLVAKLHSLNLWCHWPMSNWKLIHGIDILITQCWQLKILNGLKRHSRLHQTWPSMSYQDLMIWISWPLIHCYWLLRAEWATPITYLMSSLYHINDLSILCLLLIGVTQVWGSKKSCCWGQSQIPPK